MIRVFIPSFRQIEGEAGKNYIVYGIEVSVSGVCHKVEHRYRTFHSLHKQLKRTALATPVFPPKRLRNLTPKLLEQRRQGLEHYLQELVRLSPLPLSLLAFLELPDTLASSAAITCSLPEVLEDEAPLHQPVLSFNSDPYPEFNSTLPDIVTKGVIQGLFGSEGEDSDGVAK